MYLCRQTPRALRRDRRRQTLSNQIILILAIILISLLIIRDHDNYHRHQGKLKKVHKFIYSATQPLQNHPQKGKSTREKIEEKEHHGKIFLIKVLSSLFVKQLYWS